MSAIEKTAAVDGDKPLSAKARGRFERSWRERRRDSGDPSRAPNTAARLGGREGLAVNRKLLSAFAVLSVSAAIGGAFAAPSYATITPVAFQCQCGTLWNWTGVPGGSTLGVNEGANDFSGSEGMAADTSPSEVVLSNGDTDGAFQGADGDLWTWNFDGKVANTGLKMAALTSPSLVILPNGAISVAFQKNTHSLDIWNGPPGTAGTGSTNTGFAMAPGTSPSAAWDADGVLGVAFQANTGDLSTWAGDDLGATDSVGSTGLAMGVETSPSMVDIGNEVFDVAFNAKANTGLWEWQGNIATKGTGFNLKLGMAPETSPSITTEVNENNEFAIAFEADTGDLWTTTPNSGVAASTGLGMADTTSPSITALAGGGAAVAFQADTGALWTWTGNAGTPGVGASTTCKTADPCVDGGLDIASFTSPSIGDYIAPHGLSLTAKGEVLGQLHKPRTLVLLVYSTPQPANRHTPPPLRLVGRVALGQHPAGLSRIAWGLRVHGRRLGAGRYLVELEARIGRGLTTGGPTVKFDVGKTGKLTIGAQSSPARG